MSPTLLPEEVVALLLIVRQKQTEAACDTLDNAHDPIGATACDFLITKASKNKCSRRNVHQEDLDVSVTTFPLRVSPLSSWQRRHALSPPFPPLQRRQNIVCPN